MTRSDRRWLRDFTNLAAAQVVASALRFAAFAWSARELGPVAFGVVSVAAAVVGYLIAGTLSGLDILGTRDINASPGTVRSNGPSALIARTTTVRLTASSLVIAAVIPAIWIMNYFGLAERLSIVVSILAVTLLPLAFDPRWALVGLRHTSPIARGEVAAALVNLVVVVVFVHHPRDIVFVPIAQLASDAVRAMLLRRAIRRLGVAAPVRRQHGVVNEIRRAVPLSGAQLVRSAVITLDIAIVTVMIGKKAAGEYAAASRVFVVGLVFLGLYYQVLLPRLAAARLAGPAEVSELIARCRRRAGLFIVPLVACASVVAPTAIPLVFGDDYRRSGRLLAILVWSLAFVAFTGLYNQILIVHHAEQRIVAVVTVALVVDVVADLILLPTVGVIGAPIAAVCSEAVGLFLTARAARQVTGRSSPLA